MTEPLAEKRQLWKILSAALDAELREDTVIRGVSGLNHAVQAIAVDDRTKRVIIVSAEANPRMAALMQVDVQATMSDTKVLVARPVTIDISSMARKIFAPLDMSRIDMAQAQAFVRNIKGLNPEETRSALGPEFIEVIENAKIVLEKVTLPAVNTIQDLIGQAERLPWKEIMAVFEESKTVDGAIDLSSLIATDSIDADLRAGVCPIPLYEFGESDFEIFTSDRRIDDARERLRQFGIRQYFYPPADQVALGLVDQGFSQEQTVARMAEQAPRLGHPFGERELVEPSAVVDILAQLKALGYVAEGEHGLEVSEKGRIVRSTVRYRPREGLLTKLINRISVSLSPKDFM